jgi:hypothetical protein
MTSIRIIKLFYWSGDEGHIGDVHLWGFQEDIEEGEDIPLDLLQRWRLP